MRTEMRVLKMAYGFTVFRNLETMKIVVTETNLKKFKLLVDEIVDVEYETIYVVNDKTSYVKVLSVKQ